MEPVTISGQIGNFLRGIFQRLSTVINAASALPDGGAPGGWDSLKSQTKSDGDSRSRSQVRNRLSRSLIKLPMYN